MIDAASQVRSAGPLASEHVIRVATAAAAELDRRAAIGQTRGRLAPSDLVFGPGGSVMLNDSDETVRGVYAAPEVLAGVAPGPSSDQYALACVAIYLLTGADVDVIAWRHFVLRQTQSSWVDSALLRATDPDPARRFSSSTEFASALSGGVVIPHLQTAGTGTRNGAGFAIVSVITGLAIILLRLVPAGHWGTMVFDSFPYANAIIPLIFGVIGMAVGIVGCIGPRKMKGVAAVGIFMGVLCVLYGGGVLISTVIA
ncbi:hypothetical protein [Gordonia sp. CPCC 205333]|uniref:hypothetical protein n=1 Tax=Gordonia sp. CPCC 205333 TaxID=3140790 RepID=UPI003AF38360